MGKEYNPFRGTFDGMGHKITGLYINSDEKYIGFIGYNIGTIKNLGIESGYIYDTEKYTSGGTTEAKCIGGISGKTAQRAIIQNCYNKANIKSDYLFVNAGGISGEMEPYSTNIISNTISNCYNWGEIIVSTAQGKAGGIVGKVYGYIGGKYGDGFIESCYNSGTITGLYSGGIVGSMYGNSSTTKCYNLGTIKGSRSGGIAGNIYNGSLVEQCYNSGKIKANYSGGIVCEVEGSNDIENCYNSGEIDATTYGGGIVCISDTFKEVHIKNCYNIGTISTNQNLSKGEGTIIASTTDNTIIQNCYYSNTSDIKAIENEDDIENNVYSLTEEYMKSDDFVGLLNTNYEEKVWKIGDSNYSYPMFIWQEYTSEELPKKVLESIAVTTQPSKTNYTRGENFDSTGMVITGTYDDGSAETITDYTVIGGDNLNCLINKVIIQSNENSEIKAEVKIQVAHDMSNATCTEAAKCKVEGCTYTEGEALGHSFTKYTSNNDATCTQDGTKTAKCDRCSETHTITDEGSAHGHNYENDVCTECGEKEPKLEVTSSAYKIENTYILKVQEKTTVKTFKSNLQTNATEIKVYSKDGEEQDETTAIATGMQVVLKYQNDITIFTIAVAGDVDGDGEIKLADMSLVNRYRLNKKTLEEAYLLAADVNEDGKVDFKDLVKINRFRLHKITEL